MDSPGDSFARPLSDKTNLARFLEVNDGHLWFLITMGSFYVGRELSVGMPWTNV